MIATTVALSTSDRKEVIECATAIDPVDPISIKVGVEVDEQECAITVEDTCSSSASIATEGARKVGFSTIEIREYPRCLGDHPSVTGGGPPLSIEWEHNRVFLLELDEYEATAECHRTPAQFQLPAEMRWQIIREECQCNPLDIRDCLKQVSSTKQKRQHTYAMAEFEHIQIVLESCGRKFRRLRDRIAPKSRVN